MPDRLLERDDVLAEAAQALRAARRGRGGTFAITGDAGTGKTTVLAAIRAGAEDFAQVHVRGEEMETGLAFGVLERLLEAVDAGGGSWPAAADGSVVERSVPYVRALERLRRRAVAPLLITLDDLHWSDADSLDAVAFLARRLAELPVLVVVALRPWPPAAAGVTAALAAGGHARIVRLEPLSPVAGRELLSERARFAVPDDAARRAWEHCGGNPLLTVHVGAALGRGEDPFGEGAAPGTAAHRLLVTRFAGLDADALKLAQTASLMGASFQPAVVADLAALPPDSVVRGLEALHRTGLVEADGPERLRFVHPLLRQALYDDLVPAVRQRQHAQAFAELVRRGRSAEAAEHAIRADLAGDAEAAAVLERVGRAALRAGAVEAAVLRLDAAVRFLGDRAGALLLLTLVEALCTTGRAAEGAARCRDLLARDDIGWRTRVEALTLRGRCGYLLGEPGWGTPDLEQAVALAELHDPAAAVRPLLEQIVTTWMAAGPGFALPLSARARRLARRAEPALREAIEAGWGELVAETGNPDGIAATLASGRWVDSPSRAAALPTADLVSPLSPVYSVAHCALYAERFDDSAAAFEFAATRLEAAGAAGGSAAVSIFRSNLLLRRGRLQDALDAAERAGRYSELTSMAVPVVAALRALVLTWMGRLDEAAVAREEALTLAPDAWQIEVWAAFSRGLAALWDGDPAASDAFLVVERRLADAGVREPGHTQYAAHAVAAHLLAGRPDDARRVTEQLDPLAARHPARWPRFAVTLSRARLDEHSGAAAAAIDGYRSALAALGDTDLPLQRAEALLAGGALQRREGLAVKARPWLAEARKIAERHGAGPLAELAGAELQLAGGRRRRRTDDRDRLTPAELRVARAAAAGHSNAQIAASLHLSPNTVATHLRRVYAKLEIPGRRMLTIDALDDAR
jgi:DNA-binding CsgD family transcriptional regulator